MSLKITRATLYKNNIGFYERTATVKGNQDLHMPIKKADLQKIKKNLAVNDVDGGAITGVNFDSPSGSYGSYFKSIWGNSHLNMSNIFAAVQGAHVHLCVTGKDGSSDVSGRIISTSSQPLQLPSACTEPQALTLQFLNLLTDAGKVIKIDISEIQGTQFSDKDVAHDFKEYLQAALFEKKKHLSDVKISCAGEGERRSVCILLSYSLGSTD